MTKYIYNGPVYEFDKLICSNWTGETRAISDSKSRSNLAYQFKNINNRTATAKITLPGKLEKIGE